MGQSTHSARALMLELAHRRRMRFCVKSEALDAETRDLFQETLGADVAAAEAELARRQAQAEEMSAAPRARSASRLAGRLCPSICRASSIAMNRNPAAAASAARLCCRSAKTSASNLMSN